MMLSGIKSSGSLMHVYGCINTVTYSELDNIIEGIIKEQAIVERINIHLNNILFRLQSPILQEELGPHT